MAHAQADPETNTLLVHRDKSHHPTYAKTPGRLCVRIATSGTLYLEAAPRERTLRANGRWNVKIPPGVRPGGTELFADVPVNARSKRR